MAEHDFYAQPTVFDHWQSHIRSRVNEYIGCYRPYFWSLGFSILSLVCFFIAFSSSLSLLLECRVVSWNSSLARWILLSMAIAACGWLLQQAFNAWPPQVRLPEILAWAARVSGWKPPAASMMQPKPASAVGNTAGQFVERRARKRQVCADARLVQAFYTGVRESGVNVTIAQSMFAAGLRSPQQVRKASDEDLLSIRGVGPATVRKLRARFGQSCADI